MKAGSCSLRWNTSWLRRAEKLKKWRCFYCLNERIKRLQGSCRKGVGVRVICSLTDKTGVEQGWYDEGHVHTNTDKVELASLFLFLFEPISIIKTSFLKTLLKLERAKSEPIPDLIEQEAGYIPDRSPVYHRADIWDRQLFTWTFTPMKNLVTSLPNYMYRRA